MIDRGDGPVLSQFEERIRLPVGLSTFEKKTWAVTGDCLPSAVKPFDERAEEELIQALTVSIKSNHSIPLAESFSFKRQLQLESTTPSKKQEFILVGASHAARLKTPLEEAGALVHLVTMPSYAPNKGTVERATLELEQLLVDTSAAKVVFFMMDNAGYYAKTEEGSLIPARRDKAGAYHLEGELVVAPKEMFSSSLKVCEPLFRAAEKSGGGVLLSPMPRYWTKSCCDDIEHAPNRSEADFDQYLFTGLDGLRRHSKDFLFLHRLKNTAVLNSTQLMVDAVGGAKTMDEAVDCLRDTWGDDPVHPGADCYTNMAEKLLQRFGEEGGPTTASSASDCSSAPKRPRWLEFPEQGVVQVANNRNSGQRGRGHTHWRGRASGYWQRRSGGRRPGNGGRGRPW